MAAVAARIYIVRHGETKENRLGIMQGQLDTDLNEAGIDQALRTAAALSKVAFKKAFTSPLRRAVKTAETILSRHPQVEPVQDPDLMERNLGDWQGRTARDRGDKAPDNAEPLAAFTARATQWWGRAIVPLATEHGAEDGPANVLVVSHGGFIGKLVTNLLNGGSVVWATGGELTTKCFNASITVVELREDGKGALVTYSDTTHLHVDLVDNNVDVQDQ